MVDPIFTKINLKYIEFVVNCFSLSFLIPRLRNLQFFFFQCNKLTLNYEHTVLNYINLKQKN